MIFLWFLKTKVVYKAIKDKYVPQELMAT